MTICMKVCIGGTFDIFHRGHKQLIKKAFDVSGKDGFVFIGITSKKINDEEKKIKPFEEREQAIIKFLSNKNVLGDFVIKPIDDKYGPTVEEEFDAIVVSPETRPTAEEINEIRKQRGKHPLKIIEIPFVLADDDLPISASRIRNKEIDEEGRILNRD